eukprot:15436918-Alexandrium_andersonii.AAC.1
MASGSPPDAVSGACLRFPALVSAFSSVCVLRLCVCVCCRNGAAGERLKLLGAASWLAEGAWV